MLAGIETQRPRNLDTKRSAAILYGDWGTSKAYVIGLAFAFGAYSSFWLIAAMCVLTALVAVNYIIICNHYPDGGGVYASVRHRSEIISIVGAFLLIADYIVTAALSALSAFQYLGVPHPETFAAVAIALIGALNWFGPKHTGGLAFIVSIPTAIVVVLLGLLSVPHLPAAWHNLQPMHGGFMANWGGFVSIVLALSGVEAVANSTGVMRLDPDAPSDKPSVSRTSTPAILWIMAEVVLFTAVLGLAMHALPGLHVTVSDPTDPTIDVRHPGVDAPGSPGVRDYMLKYMGAGVRLGDRRAGGRQCHGRRGEHRLRRAAALGRQHRHRRAHQHAVPDGARQRTAGHFPPPEQLRRADLGHRGFHGHPAPAGVDGERPVGPGGIVRGGRRRRDCDQSGGVFHRPEAQPQDRRARADVRDVFVDGAHRAVAAHGQTGGAGVRGHGAGYRAGDALAGARTGAAQYFRCGAGDDPGAFPGEKHQRRRARGSVTAAGLILRGLHVERSERKRAVAAGAASAAGALGAGGTAAGTVSPGLPAARKADETVFPQADPDMATAPPLLCAIRGIGKTLDFAMEEARQSRRPLYLLFVREQPVITSEDRKRKWREDEEASVIFNYARANANG